MSSPGLTPLAATRPVRHRARQNWAKVLLVCACTLLATLSSRASFAVTLAPMCGPHAETIAAPPVGTPNKEVPLSPKKNCKNENDPRFVANGEAPMPPPTASAEVVPRLPPLRYRLPPAPRVRMPVVESVSGERPGHERAIERPPR